ncbi:hypothetical protein WJX79_010527 [Trebouxia sp. C0005]
MEQLGSLQEADRDPGDEPRVGQGPDVSLVPESLPMYGSTGELLWRHLQMTCSKPPGTRPPHQMISMNTYMMVVKMAPPDEWADDSHNGHSVRTTQQLGGGNHQ